MHPLLGFWREVLGKKYWTHHFQEWNKVLIFIKCGIKKGRLIETFSGLPLTCNLLIVNLLTLFSGEFFLLVLDFFSIECTYKKEKKQKTVEKQGTSAKIRR